jgi:hypothetical protein
MSARAIRLQQRNASVKTRAERLKRRNQIKQCTIKPSNQASELKNEIESWSCRKCKGVTTNGDLFCVAYGLCDGCMKKPQEASDRLYCLERRLVNTYTSPTPYRPDTWIFNSNGEIKLLVNRRIYDMEKQIQALKGEISQSQKAATAALSSGDAVATCSNARV